MLRAAGARLTVENAGTPVTIRGELPAQRITIEPAERLEPGEIAVPGDFSSAAFFLVAALLVRGSEVRLEGVGINPGRIGLLGILTRMGAAIEVIETAAAGQEPVATIVAPLGAAAGDPGRRAARYRWRSTSCRWSRSPPASPTARPWSPEPRSCATRSRTGSRPWSRACAGSGRRSRRPATGSRSRAPAACAAASSMPPATTGWRCSARSPGSRSRDGVEVRGFEAAGVSYPGFAQRPAKRLRTGA